MTEDTSSPWITGLLPVDHSDVAADGSLVRLLGRVPGASAIHCSVPARQVGNPSYNVGLDELWFFLDGNGQLWRRPRDRSVPGEVVDVRAGSIVSIPRDVEFQFRNTCDRELVFICMTSPAWSNEQQNQHLDQGHWPIGQSIADDAPSP